MKSKRLLSSIAVFFAAAFAAVGVCAADLPTQVRAVYKVYRGGLLIGHADERFDRNGDRFTIRSETRAEGVAALFIRAPFILTSEGRIVGDELQPQLFTSTRGDPARAVSVRFDWERKQFESTRGGHAETFELPPGTLDRLSAMYQFMLRAPAAERVTTWMSQGRKAESYTYVKQGDANLHTAAGDFDTVLYARDAKEGESKAQLWLAKGRRFLPIKVIFEDRNGKFEQQLSELTIQ